MLAHTSFDLIVVWDVIYVKTYIEKLQDTSVLGEGECTRAAASNSVELV